MAASLLVALRELPAPLLAALALAAALLPAASLGRAALSPGALPAPLALASGLLLVPAPTRRTFLLRGGLADRGLFARFRLGLAARASIPYFGVLPRGRHDPLDALGLGADALEQLAHVDPDHAFEFLGRLAGENVRRGCVAQALDRARHGLVGHRVQAQEDLLPFPQVGALGLFHPSQEFHLRQVEQLGDRHAGRHLVPFADFREGLAESAPAPGTVLQDGDQSGQRREHAGLGDPALVAVHVQLRLLQLLAQHGQFRFPLLQAVLDVLFQLLLAALGLLEREFVLAGVDRRQQLVALDLEFRSPHLEVRLDDFHLVLALADFQLGFGLDQVLFDLLDREQAVLERGHALGVVEFEDQVAAVSQGSGRRQLRDLRLRADVRRRERERAHGAQLAAQVSLDHQVAAHHLRDGEFPILVRNLPENEIPARDQRGGQQHDGDSNHQLRHG